MGENANDLVGCFDLSNPITVVRNEAAGGALSLVDGSTELTICAGDSISDAFEVDLTGAVGENSAWVITDADLNILGLPAMPPFDLEGAGGGVCLVWHLSYFGEITGLEAGANAGDLLGCFDLSNPITVDRLTGEDCTGGFNFGNVTINEVTADGMVELFNGTDQPINVSNFWLCNRPAYQQIRAMTLECGDLLIQPGEITVVSGFSGFNATDAELGLYTSSNFSSDTAIIAYLEWGSAGHGRTGVAIAAGLWEADFFLAPPTGNASLQLGISDTNTLVWTLAEPTVCAVNNFTSTTDNTGEAMSLSIFPNPVAGSELNVMLDGLEGEMMELQIFDMNGRAVQTIVSEMLNGQTTISLPAMEAGTYFLRVINSGRVTTERFTRF